MLHFALVPNSLLSRVLKNIASFHEYRLSREETMMQHPHGATFMGECIMYSPSLQRWGVPKYRINLAVVPNIFVVEGTPTT